MKKGKYQFRGKGSPCRDFPTDGSLKKQYLSKVLHFYFEEGMDYRSISEILPVSFASIGYWIRNFAKEYKSKPEIMEAISKIDETSRVESGKAKGIGNTCSSEDTDTLAAELARLKEELKYQRLRADAYDEMINVAEEQFNIKIRKKVGAKQ
jgi:transposase